MSELLFFVSAFFAEVIGTTVGFGSSTIFLPLSLFFIDFKTAITLVAFFHIFGNLGRIAFFKHGIDKKLLLVFGVPSVLLTILGAYLVTLITTDYFQFALGIFLLVFALVSLLVPNLKFPAKTSTHIIGGGLSGFLAGLIGTGGALRGAFLIALGVKKFTYIATSAAIALAVDITRIPIYLASGFLEKSFYFYVPILFLIAISGSFVGRKIVGKIPQKIFRKIALVAIAIISINLIFNAVI